MLFFLRGAWIVTAAVLLVPAALPARDVTRSDFSQRVPVENERFSTQQRSFERNDDLADKRFRVQEWHGRYNTLGRQRANIDMAPRRREVIEHRTLSFDRRETSMSRFEGRQAYIRNFGEVERSADARIHEDVEVRRFDGPMGEVRAELDGEEELAMEDLNRFFYMRNRPAGGSGSGEIPVNQPGAEN